MKLNKIHQDLKELYKNKHQIDIETVMGVRLDYENHIKRCVKIFRLGYWSTVPYAFEDYNNFAVKMEPKKKLKSMPVLMGYGNEYVTFSNNLANFLPMTQLRMLHNRDFIQYILDDWRLLEELSLPFREYTDSLDSLEFLKKYLHNEEKLKYLENTSELYTKTYLDFWNHYYDTPEQKEYVQLMHSMLEDESYLPEFAIKDYGVWNTRAYNAIGRRAYNLIDIKTEKKENQFWQSFIQPHGFDATEVDFGFIPYATSTNFQLDGIISKFIPELGNFSKMNNHPLYDVGQILSRNESSYNGEAHIEAAKVIDEELNNPVLAWDSLVSAGYWSGVNFGNPNMKAWKAAIDLSEKQGWTEINEVLIDQLEFYNHYKDKV